MVSGAAEKAYAAVVSVLTVGAVLWPLARNWSREPEDGFPLSHYPMFSARRPKEAVVNYLVGLDARGGRRLLPYTLAGTGGLNQVRRQINRAVREGRAEALCRSVASAVAERNDEFGEVAIVQVVTGRYRLVGYFAGEKEPVSEKVRAYRPVAGGAEEAS
jgi:hypothetical protein